MKRLLLWICISTLCLTQTACRVQTPVSPETETSPTSIRGVSYSEKDRQTTYTDPIVIQLADTGSTAEGEGITAEDSLIRIEAGGTYLLTGTLSNGQVLVDTPDEDVHLVLAGITVTCENSAALYIREAKNVYVTLEAGTENVLSSTGAFVQTDSSHVDAALFSKADLILNGAGTLTVRCGTGHGIVSKDDLKITGGTYAVTAAGQCIVGKDSVAVADGSFVLTGGKDGIHSEHEDTAKGNVYLDGGTFAIHSDGDGISASGTMLVTGGTYDIVTGGGSASAVQSGTEDWMGGGMQMPGGMGGRGDRGGMMPGEREIPGGMTPGAMPEGTEIPGGMAPGEIPGGMAPGEIPGGMENFGGSAMNGQTASDTTTVSSAKGLKAGGNMVINGGTFTVDAADDAVHTNADLVISGGSFTLSSGDDGIHGDSHVEINAGKIDILTSYEGIEGHTIHLAGAEIILTASDDGLNAAGGNDGSGFGGFFGGMDAFAADETAGVTISGGTLVLTASGDGIDSNGYLHVTGGTTYVNGPVNSANGALDYASEGTITGGTFIALGAAGMAMNFDSSSTQGAAMCGVNGSAGGSILLTDAAGNKLAEYSPLIQYTSLVISVPGMVKGETYTLTVDGNAQTVTMTDTIVGTGGMMGGGFGGMGGGGRQPGGRGGW